MAVARRGVDGVAESLCKICPISAVRVLRRAEAGVIAVPDQTVRPGHLMVVSAAHAQSFNDLKPVEADAFMALVAAAARAAEQASGAERYYVIRIGDKAPHLHFHLVPRVEGEPSLAPFVFGDAGWAQHVRTDATPPVELFEQALIGALRLEGVQHRGKADAGRLPAWLVQMSVSIFAGMVVFLLASPWLSGPAIKALGLGTIFGVNDAVRNRMAGRPFKWASPTLDAALGGGTAFAMFRWLDR